MLIRNRKSSDILENEVTPKALFLNRRRFIAAAAAVGAGSLVPPAFAATEAGRGAKLEGVVKSKYVLVEPPTSYDAITSYNNFYEFGTDKSEPKNRSGKFKPRPWSITVAGHAAKTGTFDLDDVIKPNALEERIYRMRCVEAWSMIIPWVGVPLADVLKRFEPTAQAKYVGFETIVRPDEMPGQKYTFLKWPYVEGLRMDEAMHPLSLLAVGLYGEAMPNQNGAPVRLVVPWKYGFKSIKSIVKITFTEKEPPTTWNISAPQEYGFYSNVNPKVDHPRWSQARERRIGDSILSPKRETLMFNGYADEVAGLYAGMDLKKFY